MDISSTKQIIYNVIFGIPKGMQNAIFISIAFGVDIWSDMIK